MSEPTHDPLRAQAIKRLKARDEFRKFLVTWIALSVLFVAIWLLTSGIGTYFWPIWPIFGVGIGVVASGINAYGPARTPRHLDENAIDAEMRKMRGE